MTKTAERQQHTKDGNITTAQKQQKKKKTFKKQKYKTKKQRPHRNIDRLFVFRLKSKQESKHFEFNKI